MRRRRSDLDRMVEALLAGRALPSGQLDETEAAVLRAAIELRAARPGADHPDEAFVTDLRRQVHEAVSGPAEHTGIGRRGLLAGAAAAVAAGVVGAVAESTLSSETPAKPVASGQIVPDDGKWVAVASAEDMAAGNVRRFATASAVGFVTGRGDTVSAVSGSCTHQGCLLQLNEAAGRLDCPCHRTAFGFDGTVLFNQLATPPAPLPEIQVRSRAGQIEAFLPREA